MERDEVLRVKGLICLGYSQVETAEMTGISASQVNKISLGDIYRDIPWPDPDVGKIKMREQYNG